VERNCGSYRSGLYIEGIHATAVGTKAFFTAHICGSGLTGLMEKNRAVQAKKIATVTFAAVTIFIVLIFGGIFLWNWFQSKLLW
jgi:hypothetical protein